MSVNIFYSPINTLKYFSFSLLDDLKYMYNNQKILNFMKYSLLCFSIWILFSFTINNQVIQSINNLFIYSMYWIFLGILSSIGLGFGIPTGILFLFPYIIKMYLFIEKNNSLDFNLDLKNDFTLNNIETLSKNNLEFYKIFLKILQPVVLWGIGTAIGEVPPYLLSYNSNENSELIDNKYFKWIKNMLNNYGSIIILFFASYPNILFDMCGICCGYLNIPFKIFFINTLIGKAFIKAPLQSLVIISLLNNNIVNLLNNFITNYFPQTFSIYINTLLINYKNNIRNENFMNNEDSLSIFKICWNAIIIFIVLLFIKNIIENKANTYFKNIK